MCGRFFLSEVVEGIDETLEILDTQELRHGSNLAPSEAISALILEANRPVQCRLRWGLIPSWSRRDALRERPLINARIETVTEKPSFKESFAKRRAIIPAHGFIEWRRQGSTKTPYRVGPQGRDVVGFVAIWDAWRSPQGQTIRSCAVLTREAHPEFQAIHHRVPVMLPAHHWVGYLRATLARPEDIIASGSELSTLEVSPIGTGINRPGSQSFELLKPQREGRFLRA